MIEKMNNTIGSYMIRIIFTTGLVLGILLGSLGALAQENEVQDTAKVQLNYNKVGEAFSTDSGYVQTEALDIGSNRGLFILSPDRKMQMRILGSVRAAFNYTDQDLDNKSSLNPFEIPTNISTLSPNYFASLSQTRLGFEVTRRTKKKGDVFIRIEADFAGGSNHFRLRHAYGQFPHLIVGQTWSLFSNVSYQPATVSFDGVAGSVSLRTPQIRFLGNISGQFKWAAGIEYSHPDFVIPDSIQASLLQVIPDLTAQISFTSAIFSGQLAGIVTTISGRDRTDKISYGFGFGGSVAGQFTVNEKNKIFFSLTSGQAISHFVGVFGGKRQDATYDPINQEFVMLTSISGFAGYSHDITENLIANISGGFASVVNKDFQATDEFNYGYNAMINVFWEPVEGARLGVEYANGQRFDKGGERGMANKISLLLYYDF